MPKQPKQAKAAKQPKPAKADDDGLVEAVVARDFTSTIFGNLSGGQKIRISSERKITWKDQGLIK